MKNTIMIIAILISIIYLNMIECGKPCIAATKPGSRWFDSKSGCETRNQTITDNFFLL